MTSYSLAIINVLERKLSSQFLLLSRLFVLLGAMCLSRAFAVDRLHKILDLKQKCRFSSTLLDLRSSPNLCKCCTPKIFLYFSPEVKKKTIISITQYSKLIT